MALPPQPGASKAAGGDMGDIWRVGVRIPPFYPDDPELWFAQLEAQFTLSNITSDSTKFYYAVTQLEHIYVSQVKDILCAPPATGKFEKLKSELVKRLSASKEKKLKQLFLHEDMGDRKPSQFLRHLRNLAGPTVLDDVLTTIWTGRLPHCLQTVVASQPKLALDDLAELADRVHEIAPATPQHQVAMACTSAPTSSSSREDALSQEICALTKEVAKLTSYVYRQSRERSQSRSRGERDRSRSQSRNRQPPADHPHCWYHYNYGTKARKCREPCKFKAGNDTGSRK